MMQLVREIKTIRGINLVISFLLILWLLILDRGTNSLAQVEVMAIVTLAVMSLIVSEITEIFSKVLVAIEITIVLFLSGTGLWMTTFIPLFWLPFIAGLFGVLMIIVLLYDGLTSTTEKHLPNQEAALLVS